MAASGRNLEHLEHLYQNMSLRSTLINSPSTISILSSTHGRLRRVERSIEKRDLRAALRYGSKEVSINQRGQICYKFRFADIVYITDITCTKEITSWVAPGSGIDVPLKEISTLLQYTHDIANQYIIKNVGWTSHTVIIVDQSGSMRKRDVDGGASRSDSVWLSLAIDFVRKQLENGEATSTDVVSIVIMNSTSRMVVDRQPMDWLLYNRIVKLLRTQEPCFDGNYGPALDLAEELLAFNVEGRFAVSLFFFSDGRPSDKISPGFHRRTYHSQMVIDRMDALLSRFGRRLSVVAVGFGRPGEDFQVLETLASRPPKFGGIGKFYASNLNVKDLALAFGSLISSTMSTKTELSELCGSKQRSIRDVRREANDTEDDVSLSEDWHFYTKEYLISCETWSEASHCWKQHSLHSPDAAGVAYRKKFFGEGAERLVAKFREVDANDNFVGPLLVAKESRFQLRSHEEPKEFHKVFCKTQARAQAMADAFNTRLNAIPGISKSIPRIQFLKCSVYTVYDHELGDVGVLVEEQLDPTKYKKWNDNKGGIKGIAPTNCSAAPPTMDFETPGRAMAAIAESDEDEIDDDEESTILIKNPVIHHTSNSGRKNVYGRTDRGKDGTEDFFKTHVCSDLCRMMARTWIQESKENE